MLDCELSMQRHVSKVTSICFFYIRRLKQIRRLVGLDVTAALVSALAVSRLDYCNAVLSGLPKSTIAPLQRAQNAAARLVKCLAPHDHIITALRDLHWLITCTISVQLQTVFSNASYSYRSGTLLTQLLKLLQSAPAHVPDFVGQQSLLWETMHKTQFRPTCFLICGTSCLEQSATCTASTHWHRNV